MSAGSDVPLPVSHFPVSTHKGAIRSGDTGIVSANTPPLKNAFADTKILWGLAKD